MMANDNNQNPRRKDYEDIVKDHPYFAGVINQKSWDYIGYSDKHTVDYLKELWAENIKRNKKLWRKHGGLATSSVGLGFNKATIGIGAGSSLKKNKDVLKAILDIDGVRDWQDRNFIIVASNHMYKPLLADGIIPDFVAVADASGIVADHLTKDIPPSGQNTILLAGMQCDPKVLKEWDKQGRMIKFYLPHTPGLDDVFRKEIGRNPEPHIILQGGNVLNSIWSIALKFFHSSVFMAVGNDLSYPLSDDLTKRRDNYYADGDYSSNIGTGRDEARSGKKWLGFSLESTTIKLKGRKQYNITLDPVGTSPTLWVYKTWLEANVLANAFKKNSKYHYYNCTEGGIAGVMGSDMTDDALNKETSWFMLDSVCPRWHTMKLRDAVDEFLKAKEMIRCPRNEAILIDAPYVAGLAAM